MFKIKDPSGGCAHLLSIILDKSVQSQVTTWGLPAADRLLRLRGFGRNTVAEDVENPLFFLGTACAALLFDATTTIFRIYV